MADIVEENIKENLSCLDESEFKILNESLENIKKVALKMSKK